MLSDTYLILVLQSMYFPAYVVGIFVGAPRLWMPHLGRYEPLFADSARLSRNIVIFLVDTHVHQVRLQRDVTKRLVCVEYNDFDA